MTENSSQRMLVPHSLLRSPLLSSGSSFHPSSWFFTHPVATPVGAGLFSLLQCDCLSLWLLAFSGPVTLSLLSPSQTPSWNSCLPFSLNLCLPDTRMSHKQPKKIQTRLLIPPLLNPAQALRFFPVLRPKTLEPFLTPLFLISRVTLSFNILTGTTPDKSGCIVCPLTHVQFINKLSQFCL